MESQIMEVATTEGIWALLFIALLFYVLNILSKKIDEVVVALKENTNVLGELKVAIEKNESRDQN